MVVMGGVSRISIHLKRAVSPLSGSVIYSVAFGTFSASPLPGGGMGGERAGCLRCVMGSNGNFCTSSFLFELDRVKQL